MVGAGLAGLTAATTARQAGLPVIVLEAHAPGGRAKTTEREGFTLNMGAHALYRGGPGMAVLTSLGIVPDGVAPPLADYQALVGDRRHALPAGPSSLLRTGALGARSKAQLIRVLGRLPRVRSHELAHISVTEWLAGQRLRPDADPVVRALLRLATYTDDTDRFSADAAVSQLQMANRAGVLYLHGGWSPLLASLSTSLDVRTGERRRASSPTPGASRSIRPPARCRPVGWWWRQVAPPPFAGSSRSTRSGASWGRR